MKNILIVDDTETNIDILVGLLEDSYELLVATNGDDAIDIAKSEEIDLILLDIMMPELDGYVACKILKQDKNLKHIPIIFITAKTDEASILKAYEVGGSDYITKPFKPKELLVRINRELLLNEYQHNLEQKVQDEIEKRKEQEKILFQQSKLASMGEMIDAIAHQWKQPINSIYTAVDGLSYDYEEGLVDDEYIEDFKNQIFAKIDHMMSTLNNFRTFLRPTKELQEFAFINSINKALNLVADDFKKYSISVDLSGIDSGIKIVAVENEFIHIFLNLLNNSKDAFVENDIKDKKITITAKKVDNEEVIEFIDNAGGIPEDIIDKIFDANFTTKKDGKGTGIGLYMSKQIAQKYNMQLSAENKNSGAKFTLVLKNI